MAFIAEEFYPGDENPLDFMEISLTPEYDAVIYPDLPSVTWTDVWAWEIAAPFERGLKMSGHAPSLQCALFCVRLAVRLLPTETYQWTS